MAGVITGTGSYDYKSTVKLSAEPNDGYNFVGWFDDNGLISSSVTYEFQVYRDKTISVLWNYYTITTSINIMDAGSISMFLQTKISVGKRVDLQATVNDGYSFIGWYDENNNLITKNELYSFIMPYNNMTFQAKYTINEYSITFNSMGGSDVHPINKNFAENLEFPDVPTKRGFVFKGWYTSETYEAEFIFDTMPAKNMTLYAKWESRSGLIDDDGYIEVWDAEYIIQLSKTISLWDKKFKLYADIDLAGVDLSPIGTKEDPFIGTFNGEYHSIKNLTIDSIIFNNIKYSTSENSFISYLGLFGYFCGTLENLLVENSTVNINQSIDNLNDYYHLYIGLLCGYMENAIISNIAVSGNIDLTTDISWIELGGAFGYTKSCTINTSKSNVAISVNKTTVGKEYFNGSLYTGGFIGRDYYSIDGEQTEINNCYSTSTINCKVTENTYGWIGGFLGGSLNNKLKITNSYSKSIITTHNCSFVNSFTTANGVNVIKSNCYSVLGESTEENNLKNRQWILDNLGWNEYDAAQINDGYVWILINGFLPKLYWEI